MTSRRDLELTRQEMNRLGRTVLDTIVRHREELPSQPVSRVLTRERAEALLAEPIPRAGADPQALVERLSRDVFSNISHVDHPSFFAFVPGPGNFVATMGAALAAGHNVFAGTWLGGSAAAMIEETVLSWLLGIVGLPADGGGLFLSGGSMANLTALAAARHAKLGGHDRHGVVYFSDQTHSAVDRALRILGFPAACVRRIPSHPEVGLDPEGLEAAIRADAAGPHRPFCVVASAGTTNTGSVDPLAAIADLCKEYGLWMHVDGAYGAAAAISTRGSRALTGLERADSIALDPHKWLFQPFECGCLLVRDRAGLRAAYTIHPDYMKDTIRDQDEINFCEYGVQLSRSFRALGVWMTLKTFGADAVGRAVDHAFELCDWAAAHIGDRPGWEVVTRPSMAILTFRLATGPEDSLNERNRQLVAALRESGRAMVSSTLVSGQLVLRLCPTNPRTSRADIEGMLDTLDAIARERGFM